MTILVAVEPTRDQARAWAVEELSKPEYQRARPGLLDQLWQWVYDRIMELLNLDGQGTWSPTAALGVGLVVLAVVVAGVLGWRRFGGAGAARQRRDGVFAAVRALTAAEHRRLAEAAEAGEDWAVAVLERFRAIARELEERTLLIPAPGRTADEVADEAARVLPLLSDRLAAAARWFDDIVYGDRPATAQAVGLLRDLDDDIRSAKPELTPAAAL